MSNLSSREVHDLARGYNTRVVFGATVLSLVFMTTMVLDMRSRLFKSIESINTIDYNLLLQTSFIIMFFSRLYGIRRDIGFFSKWLVILPNDVKVKTVANIIGLGYVLTFGLMVYIHQIDFYIFFWSNVVFWILNIAFWRSLKSHLTFLFSAQEKHYQEKSNSIEGERCSIVKNFFDNNWVRDRHWIVLGFQAIMGILLFTDLSSALDNLLPNIGEFLWPSVVFLMMVVYSEIHVWVKRLKRSYQMDYLDDLDKKNLLDKRPKRRRSVPKKARSD